MNDCKFHQFSKMAIEERKRTLAMRFLQPGMHHYLCAVNGHSPKLVPVPRAVSHSVSNASSSPSYLVMSEDSIQLPTHA